MSLHYTKLPWLIYALGGGLGHLNRVIALANVACRSRHIIIMSNSPFAETIQEQNTNENISIHVIPHDISREEGVEQVVSLLTITPCVLIVDALVRGIWGELAPILPHLTNIPKVLILRDLPLKYIVEKNLENFIDNNYDLVIVPGETEQPLFENLTNIEYTYPWLSFSSKQLPSRQEARDLLNFDETQAKQKTILILASGKGVEQEVYGFIAKDLSQKLPWVNIRCISLIYPPKCPFDLWVSHFPAFEYLPAADLVIGGCGYNLFYECMALQIPLIAFPWERVYDRQKVRAQKAESLGLGTVKIVASVEDVYYQVSEILGQQLIENGLNYTHNFKRPKFKNGVKKAVRLIEEFLPKKWNEAAYNAMEKNIEMIDLT